MHEATETPVDPNAYRGATEKPVDPDDANPETPGDGGASPETPGECTGLGKFIRNRLGLMDVHGRMKV